MFLIYLLISPLVGAICGSFHNRSGTGFWLGLFLGPIGWIIVLLIGKKEEEPSRLDFYDREEASRVRRQRESDEARRKESVSLRWRIAKGTDDLGEMDLAGIKLLLMNPAHTVNDFAWFEPKRAEWLSLACLPALATPSRSSRRDPSGVRYEG